MSVPYYADDGGDREPSVDAGRLWAGGVATAVVAALVAVPGVLIARGIFGIPVLAPTDAGSLGNASTGTLAVMAAIAALLATGMMHLLLLSTPSALRFFAWIVSLVTIVAAVAPFAFDFPLEEQLATAAINLVIGVAITSLLSGVGSSARRVTARPVSRR